MNVISVKVKDLKPYEKNPRKNDKAVKYVAESIKQFGFKVPIVIDKDNVIIAGHTRYKASKKLGLLEVPCIIADDLTDEQVKAFRLADNKVSEYSEWDYDILNLELSDLSMNMNDFGFDLDFSIEEEKEPEEDNYIVELKEPKAKLGDIYQLGNHRLMCGDSTNESDVDLLIGDENIKCIFTSPPYNMNSNMYENYNDNLKSEEYINFNLNVINNWKRHLKGYLFWNISYNKNTRWEFIEILHKIVKETNLRYLELIIWDKGHAIPITSKDMLTRQYEDILMVSTDDVIKDIDIMYLGTTEKRACFNKKKGKGITNYWKIDTNNIQLDNHKACFPVSLPAKAIKLTTNEGDIIADCFGGSGTTLIAAEQLHRKCYMMELDPQYVDVIIDRWEKYTGQKAVKLK